MIQYFADTYDWHVRAWYDEMALVEAIDGLREKQDGPDATV